MPDPASANRALMVASGAAVESAGGEARFTTGGVVSIVRNALGDIPRISHPLIFLAPAAKLAAISSGVKARL